MSTDTSSTLSPSGEAEPPTLFRAYLERVKSRRTRQSTLGKTLLMLLAGVGAVYAAKLHGQQQFKRGREDAEFPIDDGEG